MIPINTNITHLKPSATLAINQEVKALRKDGKKIVHFGFGQSPFPIHPSIVATLKEHSDKNDYLPTTGLPELKESVSGFLKEHMQVDVDSNHILIGPGSKELLFQTILLLEGTFLIPKGSWVSYLPQIKIKDGDYHILDTKSDHGYKLQAAELEAYCLANKDQHKILILNSPNNPTGAVYSKNELKALAQVCKAYEVIVLADEIYSLFGFSSEPVFGLAHFYPEGTISFGGLSKIFSAGGYRLGYAALPQLLEDQLNTFRSLFSETFSAVATPVQHAAITAFDLNTELLESINKQRSILQTIGDYLYDQLLSLGLQCTQPQGGFYMMVDFQKFSSYIETLGIQSSEEFAQYLLQEYQVALLPGSDFYFGPTQYIYRLAFVDFDGELAMANYDSLREDSESYIRDHCPNIALGVERLSQFSDKAKEA